MKILFSRYIANISFIIFIVLVLAAGVRGVYGNPDIDTLNTLYFKNEGPLELSPEKGRFALTYSLNEEGTGEFKLPIARFVTPDLGYKDGKYVSLFAPGVSFVTIPGYIIGKYFSASQVGTYATISLFALLNGVLIYLITQRLNTNKTVSYISALLFLFATPAFAYAVSLYQHHISVFFMLSSIYILIRWKGVGSLFAVWPLVVGSVVIDYPNFFLFFPIGVYSLFRIINFRKSKESLYIKIKLLGFITIISIVIPISLFAYTNNVSYGNPMQIAGTLKAVKDIDINGEPLFNSDINFRNGNVTPGNNNDEEKTAVGFFKSRNIVRGISIHLFGSERGVIWYTPVVLFGLVGMFILYKIFPTITALLVSIIGTNLLLYSMWGDPWGGWAFGSRYLIPSYALMAIFTSVTLTHFRKNIVILILFFIILSYSIGVNTLGALTTNRIPPKGEALSLELISGRKEEYTYRRNWDYLISNNSKSFIYQRVVKNFYSARDYYFMITGSLIIVFASQIIAMYLQARKEK